MVAANEPPSPSVVDRAPGLWVYEHLLALGIEGEALEFAAPLLGSDAGSGFAAEAAVARSARLRARIALHSVTDALDKEPDTLEIDASHCAALRVFRTCLTEHAGVDADALENDCAFDRLFAAVVVRSNDWNAYKKALDALFPPDTRALSEKGKSPVASPEKDPRNSGGLRPELLATFSRCRSGADENHLKAQRRKHGMSLDEMRQVAANACAVGASKYLGKDSLRAIARDLAKGTYAASRGPLPPPARGGAGFTKKAKAKAKANAAREPSSPDSRARVSPSPRKKPILTPKRKRLEKAPTRADARETTPSGDANVAPRSREDAAFDDAPNGRDTHDPYDFRNEDNAATRAFAALGAAAAAMEAEDEYYNGGGGGDDDDDDGDGVRDATPMQKVMKSLGWRRGGGGVGSDRGAESDEEEEAVAPTQAAPDEGEEEGGGGGLFSRVGGWIGLGRSGGAKRKRPEEEEDNDEEDEGIATTASMRKRADDQARERRTRASRRKLRASAPASSPRASSPAGSPGRTKIDGARRKRRKGPLGNSNRHSKRAALEANVPSLPRKKRVMWTPEETAALEAGVRAMEKEGRFDMGATDLRDGTVNDKWRRIYDMHKETFDVNGRTTMDLKDKWRNVVNARAKLAGGADADAAGASPSSWRRAMINLGLVKAPPVQTGDPSKSPIGSAARSAAPREPGVSNRHSALRKKLGFSDGTRKRAQPWLDEEVDALRAGVEKEGEGKWATILKANPEVFLDRSAVDLKDKWRNLKGRSTRTARKRVNGLDAPLSGRALALAAEAAAAAAAAAETAPSTDDDEDVVDEGDAPPRNEEDDSDSEP